jgi:dipeptidyl aminopeptidase/acylaminoacyl peptidase
MLRSISGLALYTLGHVPSLALCTLGLAALAPMNHSSNHAKESHPFGIADMLAMQRLSDPQLSPDGRWIAFNVRETDEAANRGRTDVWLAALDGSVVKQLTVNPANDSNARWSPDGRSIVFLSTRSGSSQLWRIALEGGEAVQLSDLPLDVEAFAVFPDGERYALALEVYPDAADLAATKKRDDERAASKVKARVYDKLMVRHWDTWEDGKRSHVFVWKPGAQPIDLMKGMDVDAPVKPFGGAEEIAIAPDGAEVVFAAKDDGLENAWSTNVDLWAAPADGSAAPRRLTAANRAFDNTPCFSPDGKTIAYLSMARPGFEADRLRITLLERASGAVRVLTEAFDRSFGDLCWSRDGKTLYATGDDVGQRTLYAIDAQDGSVKRLVAQAYNQSPCAAADRVVFLQDSLGGPAELCSVAFDGSGLARITHLNDARMAQTRIGKWDQFHFPGHKEEKVHGFVLKPADYERGKRYPVAFLIHGGPQGSFGNHFHYRWNPQAYAGAGYAVVFIDFHGSTGYGQAFTDSISGDWGGAPYEDLMKGLEAAIQRYDFLDGERVAALGASYGGYMINWIAGQAPERFRCLVNHDGNLDERMAYFDTEELWFPEWEHGGTPWDNPAGYTKHNPVDHLAQWKTPMLVIHGALDYRVVDTQGISTFNVLQRKGIPSKLLYFPDENHWVLKPQNSRLWHETVLGWLDRWLKQDAAASAND